MKKLDKDNIEEILPLTPMQEGMLFHYLKEPGSSRYFEQLTLGISGAIDTAIFEKSWNFVIETNEMLRAVFRWEKVEHPVLIILNEHKIHPGYNDFFKAGTVETKKWLEELKSKDWKKKFDLREVPFRVSLCKTGEDEYEMIVSNHHILYDGWSSGIILNEFLAAYDALARGEKPVPPVKGKFKDFVKWVQNRDREKSKRYWKEYLESFETQNRFPGKRKKEQEKELNCTGNYHLKLSPDTTDKWESFVKSQKITLSALFYSGWGILLQKYNYREDILFDTTVSVRSAKIKGIESTAGLLIETVPFRIKTAARQTIKESLSKTHARLREREDLEMGPPPTIKEYLPGDYRVGFDSVLVMENYPLSGLMGKTGNHKLELTSFSIKEMTRYDVTVIITEFKGIEIGITYDRALFDEQGIQDLCRYFVTLLEEMVEFPGKTISEINILSREERQTLLYEFSRQGAETHRYKRPVYILDRYREPVPIGFVGEVYCAGVNGEPDEPGTAEGLENPFIPGEKITRTGDLAHWLWNGDIESDGKVDSKVFSQAGAREGIDITAPTNPIEEKLVHLWSEVLDVNPSKISVTVDFFEMGGNSLVVIRLINKIRKELGVEIGVKEFFQLGTIAKIADKIILSHLYEREWQEPGLLSEFPGLFTRGRFKILLTMNLPFTRVFGGANRSNRCLAEEMARRGHLIRVVAPALDTPATMTRRELVEGLKSQGHDVEETNDCYIFTVKGVEVHAVKEPENLRVVLMEEIKNYAPDWIFISSEDPSQLLLRAAHEVSPGNIIYLAHTPQMLPFGPESLYPGRKRTELIGKSAVIVTISHFVSDYIREWSGFETFVNHPPHYGKTGKGGGESEFPDLSCFDRGYVLMMNPCEVKGISILLELARSLPKIEFGVVPGWGTTPTDRKKLEKEANIIFLENQPSLNDLLRSARILLMPTLWSEGFGMAAVDAMLRGIPVLSGFHGGLKEANLDTGYLLPVNPVTSFSNELDENSLPKAEVPPQDIGPWKKALLELTSLRETYEKQSKKSREAALKFVSGLSVEPLEKYLAHLSKEKGVLGNRNWEIDETAVSRWSAGQKNRLIDILRQLKEGGAPLKEGAAQTRKKEILPAEEREYYDVSYSQGMLLVIDELNERYYGYIVATHFIIEGELNKGVLKKAFQLTVDRHESFRTVFIKVAGEYKQKIVETAAFILEETDLSDHGDKEREKAIEQNISEALTVPFDLRKGPLLRVKLLQLTGGSHILLAAMHHVIGDGWSMEVFVKEVLQSYHALSENRSYSLKPLRIRYKDYALWQSRVLRDPAYNRHRIYWHEKLGEEGEIPILELPLDYPRPANKTYNGDRVDIKLEKSKSDRLSSLSRGKGASLFMVLTCAIKILLHRYSGQENIIVGVPTAGRKDQELENQVGFYLNMLVLKDKVKGSDRFPEVLERIKETCLGAYDHDDYPFDKLVEELVIKRDLRHSPLFDVLVNLEDDESRIKEKWYEFEKAGSLKLIPYTAKNPKTASSHDLAFLCREIGDGLSIGIVYNTDLFMREKIVKMAGHLERIFESAAVNPGIRVNEIDLLTKEETHRLLYRLNSQLETAYPVDLLIHEQVEKSAGQYPWRTACIKDRSILSYEELNRRANHLARELRARGVMSDGIVTLLARRSFEAVIGILGILKAGAGYLPIDPEYPLERIRYTMQDSRSKFLLIGSHTREKLGIGNEPGQEVLDLELYEEAFVGLEGAGAGKAGNPSRVNRPGDIAYVLYTSGSTGRPKGVMVLHYNVIRLFFNEENLFDFTGDDVWSLFHSWCFDLSVWEMNGALMYGGKVVIVSREIAKDPAKFIELLREEKVSILTQTPGAFYNVIETHRESKKNDLSLRYIIFAGEALYPARLKTWKVKYPGCRLINMYGITETTVHSTYKEIGHYEIENNISNIGKAIPTLSLYVFDREFRLVPMGATGELYVGGEGLARGYLNNVPLTGERFISNPYIPGERLYRSGDLVRHRSDGELVYIGRIDTQVQVRGFRVELGEIENRLLSYPGIEKAVVTAHDDQKGEVTIYAYYVSGEEIAAGEIRNHLLKALPAYMVPLYFVRIEAVPLTPNGKIDRKALPAPGEVDVTDSKYMAPGNEIEKRLVKIWQEVLEKERIGIDDIFFEIGGHSLKAARVTSLINREFNVAIGLDVFFDTPTIREIARYIETAAPQLYFSIRSLEKKKYYRASSAQKRLYFLQQMDPGETVYNLSAMINIEGKIEKEKIENAFEELIKRHESLRTAFGFVGEELVQQIEEEAKFAMEYFNLEGLVSDNEGSRLKAKMMGDFIRPFDLEKSPLVRVGLIRESEISHILMLEMHHIITDGISMAIFKKEFMDLYNGEELPFLRIGYKDYAGWQEEEKAREKLRQQEEYWLDEFKGEIPLLNLGTDYTRPSIQEFEGESIDFQINREETGALKSLALQEGATLFMLLLSVYTVQLSKISGQEDILVGTPVAARQHADLGNIIGMFVNTLVLRNYPAGEKSFREFLKEVKERTSKSYENQEYPFEDLVEKVTIERDPGRNPLFDVMFSLQTIDIPVIEIPGVHLKPYKIENKTSKFDMSLLADPGDGDELSFTIEYRTKLFKEESRKRFITYFKRVLSSVIQDPGRKLSGIEIIGEEEKSRVLYAFNDTAADYPKDKTIHGLFEEQAERTPGNTALHGCMIAWMHGGVTPGDCPALPVGQVRHVRPDGPVHLTYRELNDRSHRLAGLLIEKGIQPGTIVGIMVERSVEMIIGIMGILKAGGAYLPIDPGYPGERIKYMLGDSGTRILLTQVHRPGGIDELSFPGKVLYLPEVAAHGSKAGNRDYVSPGIIAGEDGLMYVEYTSGSTGKPKGVSIDHRNVVNFMQGMTCRIDFSPLKTILALTTICFDIFVLETWVPLACGLKVAIASERQQKDPGLLAEVIVKQQVDMLQMTPSSLKLLTYQQENPYWLKAVKELMLGGEQFPDYLLEWVKNRFKGKIYNLYGPTETTVWSTLKDLSEEQRVTIGGPIANTQVYILDRWNLLQPVGAAGELCIGGDGLARGYLNKPELTAERFIMPSTTRGSFEKPPLDPVKLLSKNSSPHSLYSPYSTIYKTGDLARWRLDGNIEFMGRIDHQVKIRGFRIELGEIENRLLEHDEIKEIAVVLKTGEQGDSYLCAYFVPKNSQPDTPGDSIKEGLREYLLSRLPGYMVPPFFIPMDRLPLTSNGKIDRKALPAPDIKAGDNYGAPGDEIEIKLVEIWSGVLGIEKEKIGINDNFFHLGGHSLKATILVSRIHKELKVKVPLAEIFKTSHIRGLAAFITNLETQHFSSIEAVEKKGYYILSSAQRRLFFLQQMDEKGTAYNMLSVMRVEGELDEEKFEKVFQQLIRRHESLRTSFHLVNEEPVQVVHDEMESKIEYYNLAAGDTGDTKKKNDTVNREGRSKVFGSTFFQKGGPPEAIIKSFIRPFDLSKAPLLRLGFFKTGEGGHFLLVDLHHIISDAVSQQLLITDFISFYEEKELPSLRLQYKDFSEWQNSGEQREARKQQEEYWLGRFKGDIPLLNIPTDLIAVMPLEYDGEKFEFEIRNPLIDKTRKILSETGVTLFMMLLAVYTTVLSIYTGQEDIVVGSPIAGRSHKDLQDILGMFVNMLPMRNYPRPDKTFREFLKEVKTNSTQAFENQDTQFDDLVNLLGLNRDLNRKPLVETVFTLQNAAGLPGSEAVDTGTKLQFDTPQSVPFSTKYDLILDASETKDSIMMWFSYTTRRFERSTIEKIKNHYIDILEQVVENIDIKLKDITISHDLASARSSRIKEEQGDFGF